MSELSKRRESLIKSLYTRHGRKKHDLCVCEGIRSCNDLFAARPDLVEFVIVSKDLDLNFPDTEIIQVSDSQLEKITATVNSQGILAVTRKPEPASGTPADPFILLLDRITDPGNMGTILRTLRAAGLKELWLTSGSADPFNDKVIRSAMASQFIIELRTFPDLAAAGEALAEFGYNNIYRTDVSTGASCFTEPELFNKSAIILGSEAHGAGELAGSRPVTIPMPGDEESLNVAQAATIILFEYVRRITG